MAELAFLPGPPILQVAGLKFLSRNEAMHSLLGHLGEDSFHSNKISTVQFGIQLCHTDPRLSCSFSTLNPRADIDRWDFHSVRLFTVEIWLE